MNASYSIQRIDRDQWAVFYNHELYPISRAFIGDYQSCVAFAARAYDSIGIKEFPETFEEEGEQA